jgi:FtsH-binding integral membrane protein
MKKIFAIMALAFALTTVMAAVTVLTYTDQAAACAPGQVC